METPEQFIELETARLARKAGFDWKVTSFYNPSGKVCYCSRACNLNGEIGPVYDLSRPTQSVLQKWLREVKNIYIIIFKDFATIDGWHYFVVKKEDWNSAIEYAYQQESNNHTYEEALEAGIVKSLEIILKMENKK